jgi:PsbP
MRCHQIIAFGAILAFVSAAAGADGTAYVDPSGFSFSYPRGWVAVAKPNLSLKESDLPLGIQSWIKKNNVDLSRVSVTLIRNGQGAFLENLNVVVDQQQIPTTAATVKKLLQELPKQYQSMGLTVENLRVRLEKVGKNDAITVDYEAKFPGLATPLRQMQVYFAGGGKTYIVTCSALADAFAEPFETFDTILATFKVPGPVLQPVFQQGFDWNRMVTMGLIAGLIGGLAGLVKKLVGTK